MANILQLRSEFRDNGPGTQSLTIGIELRSRGHNIWYCSSGGVLCDHIRRHGFEILIVPTLAVSRRDPVSTLRSIFAIGRAIRKNKIDIVHAHNAATAYCAYFAQVVAGRKVGVVHSVRGIELRRTHQWRNLIYRFYPPLILAVSQFTKRELIRLGARAEKIFVSYNGVDSKKFCIDNFQDSTLRTQYDLEDCVVIASVGAFDGWKGQEVLVRALPSLMELNPTLRVVFVGDGPTLDPVKDLAANLGVAQYIRFLGFRTDVPEILSMIDIYALPSTRGEMFPNSILEAMSMSIPWVGSDISGLGEMTADGKAGVLCEPSSVDSLVNALSRLVVDSKLRRQMGDAARTEVLNRFSVSQVVDVIEGVYRQTGHFPVPTRSVA